METNELQTLANAFYAASENLREPVTQALISANGHDIPPDPGEEMARRLSADVLKAIGDVYMGQAVQGNA